MSDAWITLNGTRYPARLTATRIVVTISPGREWGHFRWTPRESVTGYFDLSERRSDYGRTNFADWKGHAQPIGALIDNIDLANPNTWPECSPDVHAALTAQAKRGMEIEAERRRIIEGIRKARERDRQIKAAADALIAVAVTGDDAAILAAAAAYREVSRG
jgi:hypothetical protein